MASARDTLKYSFMFYPSLFPNKISVCDHLFLVIGNGYEWDNGELVGVFHDDLLEGLTHKQLEKQALKSLRKEFKVDEPYSAYTLKQWEFQIKNVELLLEERMTLDGYSSFYTLHPEYSHIATLPDDITDDWLELAERFLWEYEHFLRYRIDMAVHYFMDAAALTKELEKLGPVKTRIDEIKAKKLGMTLEEFLDRRKKKRSTLVKAIKARMGKKPSKK